MIYQGSKARLRKYILPILQDCIEHNNISVYIEPFCGGCNIIDHISCETRIASDNNAELIELLKYMQSNPNLDIFPEHCSFEHYATVRENRYTHKYETPYIAGIGYFASYGGRYYDGGFGNDPTGKRNIYAERLKSAKEQASLLRGIEFNTCDYTDYIGTKGALFYLDPPYRGTKSYGSKSKFDYERFYDFCREISKDNYLFVSEYDMPMDFSCIWSKERKVSQKSNRFVADIATERLWKVAV